MFFALKNLFLLICIMSVLIINGCQVVSVKKQALNVSINNERDSILTRKKISEASLNVLSMTGRQADQCTDTPEQCVNDLKEIPQILDEQFLSTASEIYLTKALSFENSHACSTNQLKKLSILEPQEQAITTRCIDQQLTMLDKSIRYSYAYLFHTKRHPSERLFDNRQVQIRDFYNQALAKMVTIYNLRYGIQTMPKKIHIAESVYSINDQYYPPLATTPLENLQSSYNLNFSGLRSINRRDGFGAEFVASLPASIKTLPDQYIVDPLNYDYPQGSNPNIHQPRYLSLTITAEPKFASSVDEIIHHPHFQLNIYDPNTTEKVMIDHEYYPLSANFSAPYGLWLAENNLGISAYLTLIDRDKSVTMPHLYMLEHYHPNKKIIVLVHGLASSPEAWIQLTNDIMGDTTLRENYQVWQVFYSTNMPILESHYQIRSLIHQAFSNVNASDSASKDAVLIGHSMGGIITRLMVSEADLIERALGMLKPHQQKHLINKSIFQARLKFNAIPNFSRAIFLASPHKGTEYAERWFTLAARKVIKVPGAFLGAMADSISNNTLSIQTFMKDLGHGLVQNGPSDLSHHSKFNQLTKDVIPVNHIQYHSILGNLNASTKPEDANDGVVAYDSAHLDGAASEIIIKGGHSIQETPEAILELRRILRLHLQQLNRAK